MRRRMVFASTRRIRPSAPGATLRSLAIVLGLAAPGLASCGQALTNPEDLVIKRYPKDTPFRISLTMRSCSDRCSTYETPECAVAIEGTKIELDVSVAYDERAGTDRSTLTGCSEACGPPVYAHCEVRALGAGTYTVESGGFRREIVVE